MAIPSLSSYPRGFSGGVSILGMPVLNTHAGNVFWVNSNGGSNGNKGTRFRPFATLDFAFERCTANNGDLILVAPNHAETITGAAGIAHDVAGVSVIGLGVGNNRPRFLMDGGTTVTYAITADDAHVENIVFASGNSNVVTCFTTTKKGSTFVNLEFENNTTNEDFLTCIKATSTTDNDSDNLTVIGCRWLTIDVDDLEFLEINATLRGLVFRDNFIVTAGTASPAILVATGKLLTAADIGRNRLVNAMTANELFISNDGTTNTGIVWENYVGHADVTGAHDVGWDGGGFRLFGNLSTSVDNLQGVVVPAADVNL
jgi:hypothetical protein